MSKNLIISTFKNCNGSKVNAIYTGAECLFFVPDWGTVFFAEIDADESEKQNKTIYRVFGDVGTRSFDSYIRQLKKLYTKYGINKPFEVVCKSVSSTYLSNIDITFKK